MRSKGRVPKLKSAKVWSLTILRCPPPLTLTMVFLLRIFLNFFFLFDFEQVSFKMYFSQEINIEKCVGSQFQITKIISLNVSYSLHLR